MGNPDESTVRQINKILEACSTTERVDPIADADILVTCSGVLLDPEKVEKHKAELDRLLRGVLAKCIMGRGLVADTKTCDRMSFDPEKVEKHKAELDRLLRGWLLPLREAHGYLEVYQVLGFVNARASRLFEIGEYLKWWKIVIERSSDHTLEGELTVILPLGHL
jgi:hypothetical protein